MVAEAEAILGVNISATLICGQDFTDQRYENLKTRFLLRLAPEDSNLIMYSTYVDDALDLFAQVPIVGARAARDWYARVLHVSYALVWVRNALAVMHKPHVRLARALDSDSAAPSSTHTLLRPASCLTRDQPWYGRILAPATVAMVGSIWRRATEIVVLTKEFWTQEEELIFALMHLERGIRGGRENTRVSRSWMVFHAAKLAQGGMGLIANAEVELRKSVEAEHLLALPRLTAQQVKHLVAYAFRKAPGC